MISLTRKVRKSQTVQLDDSSSPERASSARANFGRRKLSSSAVSPTHIRANKSVTPTAFNNNSSARGKQFPAFGGTPQLQHFKSVVETDDAKINLREPSLQSQEEDANIVISLAEHT